MTKATNSILAASDGVTRSLTPYSSPIFLTARFAIKLLLNPGRRVSRWSKSDNCYVAHAKISCEHADIFLVKR